MTRFTDKGKKGILDNAAAAAFWIIVWAAAAHIAGQELILPSPVSVIKTLFKLCHEREFWLSALGSLGRVVAGFFFGTVSGTLLAALTAWIPAADVLISPVLRIVRATPVASFIILVNLWVGKMRVPGFVSALMVAPVIWAAVETAIKQTDPGLLQMADMYRMSGIRKLRYIYIPSVMPSWSGACLTAMGLAWKSGIAAEVLYQPKNAVGSQLYFSKVYLETPALFSWTAVVIIMSFLLEKIIKKLAGRARR